ncbi:MAG TPA: Ig-like domain-containing protein [Vicinamibacterales bacterium]|jgi:hypothetical protein|nr:Ig-like domain-containing protein [Vicinamibacterales bacterium]
MRLLKAFGLVLAIAAIAACDCKVPSSPSEVTTNSGNPSGNPTDTTPPLVIASLAVQGATSIRVGDSAPWQAVASYSNGTQDVVTAQASWSSNTASTASVNANGVVSGVAPGQATIQATFQGKQATGVVTIVPAGTEQPTVVSLAIEGNTSIHVGDTTPLQAIARLSDGSSQTVTALASWSSDNAAVAPVDAGSVHGTAAGQTTIHASYSGKSASAPVTVSANTPGAPTVIGLSIVGNTSIQIGQSTQLQAVAQLSDGSAQTVTTAAAWSSSATNVATVSGGLVTGQSAGTAPIQASYQGKIASAGIVVSSGVPPTVLALSISGPNSVQAGQTVQLQATAQLSDGTSQTVTGAATWSSGSPSVATVSAGLVTGQTAGTSVIGASYSGKTAQMTMTVTSAGPPAPTKQLTGIDVTADVDLQHLDLTQAAQLHVYGVYSDGSRDDVTNAAVYNPDDPQAIHVNPDGTFNVAATLAQALLDPNHVVNVQYGGFTEGVHFNIKLPVLQNLALGTDGMNSLSIGNQMPDALTAVFSGGQSAALGANFPGVSWTMVPDLSSVNPVVGTLIQPIVNQLGPLNQILGVDSHTGQLVVLGQKSALLTQLITALGGSLPVNATANYNGELSNTGLQSNTVQATVSH